MVANAADVGYRIMSGEKEQDVPKSLKVSADMHYPSISYHSGQVSHRTADAQYAHSLLSQGVPIEYDNDGEASNLFDDAVYPSYVAPKASVTSWEKDVLASSRSSDMAKNFAKQRIAQGKEGSVLFPHTFHEPLKQISMPLDLPETVLHHNIGYPTDYVYKDDEHINVTGVRRAPKSGSKLRTSVS
jgi:hypothetical protein